MSGNKGETGALGGVLKATDAIMIKSPTDTEIVNLLVSIFNDLLIEYGDIYVNGEVFPEHLSMLEEAIKSIRNYHNKHGSELSFGAMPKITPTVTPVVVVPYQRCPVCNDNGKVLQDGFVAGVFKVCDVCNGSKIIPMHVLNG